MRIYGAPLQLPRGPPGPPLEAHSSGVSCGPGKGWGEHACVCTHTLTTTRTPIHTLIQYTHTLSLSHTQPPGHQDQAQAKTAHSEVVTFASSSSIPHLFFISSSHLSPIQPHICRKLDPGRGCHGAFCFPKLVFSYVKWAELEKGGLELRLGECQALRGQPSWDSIIRVLGLSYGQSE